MIDCELFIGKEDEQKIDENSWETSTYWEIDGIVGSLTRNGVLAKDNKLVPSEIRIRGRVLVDCFLVLKIL